MEAVARQFATDEHVMVIRNGWFSFRWTEIFDVGGHRKSIPSSHTVLKAVPVEPEDPDCIHMQYAPHPIDGVVEAVLEERPRVLFAPHVETSTGMILPDDYIRKAAKAVHEVDGLFVLDCIGEFAAYRHPRCFDRMATGVFRSVCRVLKRTSCACELIASSSRGTFLELAPRQPPAPSGRT